MFAGDGGKGGSPPALAPLSVTHALSTHAPLCCPPLLQYLAPPHVILRHGLIQGDIYPLAPAHIARFLAATLFKSSLLAVDTERLRCVGG